MNPMMIKKLQKMQRDMQNAQEAILQREFREDYQGVIIEMLGTREIARIEIDPDLLDTDSKDMLQEILQVAINNCMKQIEQATEEAMKPFSAMANMFGM